MHLFEQIVVMLGCRSELYHHRHSDMVLHHRMYLHASFLLAGFGMTANSFEDIVKEGDRSRIHHIEEFFPILGLVRIALVPFF